MTLRMDDVKTLSNVSCFPGVICVRRDVRHVGHPHGPKHDPYKGGWNAGWPDWEPFAILTTGIFWRWLFHSTAEFSWKPYQIMLIKYMYMYNNNCLGGCSQTKPTQKHCMRMLYQLCLYPKRNLKAICMENRHTHTHRRDHMIRWTERGDIHIWIPPAQ